MSESTQASDRAYSSYFTSEHKIACSRLTEDLVEVGFSHSHYTETLVQMSRQLDALSSRMGTAHPAVWVESFGQTVFLASLDHLRRDVRYGLLRNLVQHKVIQPYVSHSVRATKKNEGVQMFYLPFKFGCSMRGDLQTTLRRLHSELTSMYRVAETYVPDLRTLEERIEEAFRTDAPVAFRGHTLHRVRVGHQAPVAGYRTTKRSNHDSLTVQNDATDRRKHFTKPKHPVLVRETYLLADGSRIQGCLTLYINLYVTRPDGTRVHMAFDYSILALTIELPASERFRVFLDPPKTIAVTPQGGTFHTLAPMAWFKYELTLHRTHRAAAWWAIACMMDQGVLVKERLRALDRMASGNVDKARDPPEVVELCALPKVPDARFFPWDALERVYTEVPSKHVRDGHVKKDGVHLSAPLGARGAWAVRTLDGTYAPAAVARRHDFLRVLRDMADACISSYMLDLKPLHHVSYITSESMQDIFY